VAVGLALALTLALALALALALRTLNITLSNARTTARFEWLDSRRLVQDSGSGR